MTTIYIGSDHLIKLSGLKNSADGSSVNDATVQCTLYDEDGGPVAGQTWPLVMPYISASNGDYQATLEEDLQLTRGSFYTAVIVVTAPGDVVAKFQLPLQADNR